MLMAATRYQSIHPHLNAGPGGSMTRRRWQHQGLVQDDDLLCAVGIDDFEAQQPFRLVIHVHFPRPVDKMLMICQEDFEDIPARVVVNAVNWQPRDRQLTADLERERFDLCALANHMPPCKCTEAAPFRTFQSADCHVLPVLDVVVSRITLDQSLADTVTRH